MKFTDQQEKAINTLDKSILVSAAAGSGKTAVLVERIINIILSGEADVDQMLVVTFTKAAASEMRVKLAKAIKKKIKDASTDARNKEILRKQLNKLYKAYISTFDSFAVRVIKEFFYQVDIEPNFNACDEIESTMMQREAIDNLFDDAFANDDLIDGGSFRKFLRLYSSDRNDEEIKHSIIDAYNKLRTIPNYWEWAAERAETIKTDEEKIKQNELASLIIEDIRHSLERAIAAAHLIHSLFAAVDLEKAFYEKLYPEIESLEKIFKATVENKLTNELISEITGFQTCTLAIRNKEQKDAYESIKDEVKKLREAYKAEIKDIQNKYFLPSFESRISEMNESYKHTVYFIEILKKFEEYYIKLKKQNKLIDFADMEHYAIKILSDKSCADVMRNRFKFIFIDEYQDTNNVQEFIINQIARPNNVFKVGDVKQSIYRFRQAEPAIFQRVYQEYSCEANSDAETIDLNKNFRTNDKTIKYINSIFEKMMEGYDEKAKLYTGINDYDSKYDFFPEVHVLYKEYDDAEDDANSEEAYEIENLSSEEAEAEYVAKQVDALIGTEFYDTKNNLVRNVEARDIVVLLRSVKMRGDVFARTLRAKSIEAHVDEGDNYYDTVEIGMAIALFSCIDNMKKDVPLIATLHSEIFEWSTEELAEIRVAYSEQGERRAPYWEALSWYAEQGSKTELKEKAINTIAKIMTWRGLVNMMSLDEFIWKVLVDSGYYLKVGAMYGGDRRQANLRTLVDRAKMYSERGVASLNSFLNFVEIMKEKEIKSGQVSIISKEDNVVQITTIHKSKGLEYPFVIVAGMGHAFQNEKRGLKFVFDSTHGISLPYVNNNRKFWRSTLINNAVVSKANREEHQENQRLLYVALTRARNKLILVGTAASAEELEKFLIKPRTFLQMMQGSIKSPFNKFYGVNLDKKTNIPHDSKVQSLLKTRPKTLSRNAEKIYPNIDRILSFEYAHQSDLTAKAKYSVSEIRQNMFKAEKKKDVKKLLSKEEKGKSARIGTAYHRIMEFIDFTKLSEEYIRERIDYLIEHGVIENDIVSEIDSSKIIKFFDTDLGKRTVKAAQNGTLKKEKSFTLRTEWQDENILVQGVIDCVFEEDGKLVLIDYKTSNIDREKNHDEEIERIRAEYILQLDMYSKAIEEGTGKTVDEAYLYLFTTGDIISCK